MAEDMKSVYEKDGIERGRRGIISFDEVKIKEGLIYEPQGVSHISLWYSMYLIMLQRTACDKSNKHFAVSFVTKI